MIASLAPHPKLKNTGVRWLEHVPPHWDVRKLRQIGSLSKGSGGNKGDEVPTGIPCVRYGDLYTTHSYFILKSRSFVSRTRAKDYTPIAFGDVLFAASGETIDEIGKSAVNLMRSEARCGGDIILFRSRHKFDPRFIGYASDCYSTAAQKAAMGRGITVKHIYTEQLKGLTLALPPSPEQAAIARFLDYADQRIRRYIHAKQRLLRLLDEQKQVIVHRAATRGLDPDVRLKRSDVEWLGDVPEHWEATRLARVIADGPRNGISPPVDERGAIESFSISAIRDGRVDVRDGDKKYISGDSAVLEGAYRLLRGDVLLVRGNGNIRLVGKAGVVEHDMPGRVYPDLLMRIRLRRRCLPEFLAILLNCRTGRNQIEAAARTAVGTFKINSRQVRRLCFALPPVEEQRRIIDWLSVELRALNAASERAQDEILLLREYRARLISDVVTGKLDVREAVKRLPNESDSELLEGYDSLADVEDDAEDVDCELALEEAEA